MLRSFVISCVDSKDRAGGPKRQVDRNWCDGGGGVHVVLCDTRACGGAWSTWPDGLGGKARLRAHPSVRGLDRTRDLCCCAAEARMSNQDNAIYLMQIESTLTCPR
jgi:hypothetical protein